MARENFVLRASITDQNWLFQKAFSTFQLLAHSRLQESEPRMSAFGAKADISLPPQSGALHPILPMLMAAHIIASPTT